MAAVGITETVKGDVRKFEIWYNAREEVYIVQVGPHSLPGRASGTRRVSLARAGVWKLLWSLISQRPCKGTALSWTQEDVQGTTVRVHEGQVQEHRLWGHS